MKQLKRTFLWMLCACVLLGMAGCANRNNNQDGTGTDTVESGIDNAVDDTGDAVDDAVDGVTDGAEDLTDGVTGDDAADNNGKTGDDATDGNATKAPSTQNNTEKNNTKK